MKRLLILLHTYSAINAFTNNIVANENRKLVKCQALKTTTNKLDDKNGIWYIVKEVKYGNTDQNWANEAFDVIERKLMKTNEVAYDNSLESYEAVFQNLKRRRRWNDAIEFLKQMKERSSSSVVPTPTLSTYNAVLAVLQFSGKREAADAAINLVSSMLETANSDIQPTTETLNLAISACRKTRKWRETLLLMDAMNRHNIPLNTDTFNEILIACSKNQPLAVVNKQFDKMRELSIQPNLITYNTLMSAYVKAGKSKEALSLFDKIKFEPTVLPDIVTYTTAMRAYIKDQKIGKALMLFETMQDKNMDLDVYAYACAIDACAKGNKWKKALDYLDEMRRVGIEPNAVAYSAAINACGNGGQWERALELLHQMDEKKISINVFTYNAAISALAKSSRKNAKARNSFDDDQLWKRALHIVDEMKGKGLKPDVFTYTSAIDVCGNGGRWKESLDLIKEIENGDKRPNKIAYTSAITACSRVGKWAESVDLFRKMTQEGIEPDLIAYNAMVTSLMYGNNPKMAFDVWREICDSELVSPDIITLTNVAGALDQDISFKEKMDTVFDDAVKRGLVLKEDSLDTTWEVDLSGMSLAVARAACRFVVKRAYDEVKSGNDVANELVFITGCKSPYQDLMDKRRQKREDDTSQLAFNDEARGGIREYIQESLRKDFVPPLLTSVPEHQLGTVIISKECIQRWIESQP